MNEATRVWHTSELVADGLDALRNRGAQGLPFIEGRIMSVKATPHDGSTSHMSLGMSVIPPGYSTPAHSHPAEELATVLSGTGAIVIDGTRHEVRWLEPGALDYGSGIPDSRA